MFDLAGSIGAEVIMTDPIAPSYDHKAWNQSRLEMSLA